MVDDQFLHHSFPHCARQLAAPDQLPNVSDKSSRPEVFTSFATGAQRRTPQLGCLHATVSVVPCAIFIVLGRSMPWAMG